MVLALFPIGGFLPVLDLPLSGPRMKFQRFFEPEGSWIQVHYEEATLALSLQPAISSMEHHAQRRQSGGCMFEMAWRYAEKVNGIVEHMNNIGPCAAARGSSSAIVAIAPDMPLRFDALCVGWQAVFLAGGE